MGGDFCYVRIDLCETWNCMHQVVRNWGRRNQHQWLSAESYLHNEEIIEDHELSA